MKSLRYHMQTAYELGFKKHPQDVMLELKIEYQHATPQSIADQWWFWNCTNVPEDLPVFLTELTVEPLDAVGYGLSLAKAEELEQGFNRNEI